MVLLAQLDAGSSTLYAIAAMFVMGLGLGLVMQVLVLAVQNAVGYADLGVATSGATLFRSMGGSLGTAALGAVFTARLRRARGHARRRRWAARSTPGPSSGCRLPSATATPARSPTRCRPSSSSPRRSSAFAFLLTLADRGAPAAADGRDRRRRARPSRRRRAAIRCACCCASSLARRPHRAPRPSSSAPCEAAGVGLPPGAAWLLVQAARGRRRSRRPTRSSRTGRSTRRGCTSRSRCSNERGLVAGDEVTEGGDDVVGAAARGPPRVASHALVADWSPDDDARLNDAIARLARELAAPALSRSSARAGPRRP